MGPLESTRPPQKCDTLILVFKFIRCVCAKKVAGLQLFYLKIYFEVCAPFCRSELSVRRAAIATATFSSAKFRQDLGLGGLTSRGDPASAAMCQPGWHTFFHHPFFSLALYQRQM